MATVLARVHRARRIRLLTRSIVTAVIIGSGAVLSPYVAQATLTVADWATLYYPVGGVYAAFIAWRIARRQFN